MIFHKNAFKDVEIIILDENAQVSAEIQETISEALPMLEIGIESFEHYLQAYNYCKNSKKVGVMIINDHFKTTRLNDVITELCIQFTNSLPFAAVALYHDGSTRLEGLREFKNNSNVVLYQEKQEFLDKTNSPILMRSLWEKFTEGNSKELFGGEGLQNAVIEVYKNKISAECAMFQQRVISILRSNLNLSWMDVLVLDWCLPIKATMANTPEILAKNTGLTKLISSKYRPRNNDNVKTIAESENDLSLKVIHIIELLTDAFIAGNFEQYLNELCSTITLKDKGMLRAIKQHQSDMIKLHRDLMVEPKLKIAA